MSIELIDVSKSFRSGDGALQVLSGVNAKFPDQGLVAIMGPSGIGKSTLLHLIGGLDVAESGQIRVGDYQLDRLKEHELAKFRGRNIGFIFQFHHLLAEFTAQENVMMPLLISGVGESEARQRADELILKVGLKERAQHQPGKLSGGEQQRIAIARALVSRPRVVLADEPTGNLDRATSETVQKLMFDLQKELEALFIIVTHSAELAQHAETILEMGAGGSLSEVQRSSL